MPDAAMRASSGNLWLGSRITVLVWRTWSLVVAGGCYVLPPAPFVPMHVETAADPKGSTTAMIVVGTAGPLWGDAGFGIALRVEHQETTRTSIGLELGGGRLKRGPFYAEPAIDHWLVAVRTFGRFTPRSTDMVAATYGAGLSVMDTGLVTASVHGGGALGEPNDHLVPTGNVGIALAVPIRHGVPFGNECESLHVHPCERTPGTPQTELYFYADLGLLAPIGDTGNRISLALGVAQALRRHVPFVALTAADSQRRAAR